MTPDEAFDQHQQAVQRAIPEPDRDLLRVAYRVGQFENGADAFDEVADVRASDAFTVEQQFRSVVERAIRAGVTDRLDLSSNQADALDTATAMGYYTDADVTRSEVGEAIVTGEDDDLHLQNGLSRLSGAERRIAEYCLPTEDLVQASHDCLAHLALDGATYDTEHFEEELPMISAQLTEDGVTAWMHCTECGQPFDVEHEFREALPVES